MFALCTLPVPHAQFSVNPCQLKGTVNETRCQGKVTPTRRHRFHITSGCPKVRREKAKFGSGPGKDVKGCGLSNVGEWEACISRGGHTMGKSDTTCKHYVHTCTLWKELHGSAGDLFFLSTTWSSIRDFVDSCNSAVAIKTRSQAPCRNLFWFFLFYYENVTWSAGSCKDA